MRLPSKGRKVRVVLVGGPYDGHALYSGCPGTYQFSVGEWTGHYNREGMWVSK